MKNLCLWAIPAVAKLTTKIHHLIFIAIVFTGCSNGKLHFSDIEGLERFLSERLNDAQLESLGALELHLESTGNLKKFASSYLRLQKLIAKHIPKESQRPLFSLHLQLQPGTPTQTVGLLGGMGPLSDAHILAKVANLINIKSTPKNTALHLLSAPPPRTFGEIIWDGPRYLWQIWEFFRSGYDRFFLLSNTAHLHYEALSFITLQGTIFHLPKAIVALITPTADDILIFNTSRGVDGQLFQEILDNSNFLYLLPDEKSQSDLQAWIDQAKKGTFSKEDRRLFINFVDNLMKKSGSRHILLGCTELPLAFGDQLNKIKSQYVVYDSELILVHEITRTFLNAS